MSIFYTALSNRFNPDRCSSGTPLSAPRSVGESLPGPGQRFRHCKGSRTYISGQVSAVQVLRFCHKVLDRCPNVRQRQSEPGHNCSSSSFIWPSVTLLPVPWVTPTVLQDAPLLSPKPESTEGGGWVSVLKRQEGAPLNLG